MKSNKRAGRDLHEQAIYNALYSNKTLVFSKNMLNLTKITKIDWFSIKTIKILKITFEQGGKIPEIIKRAGSNKSEQGGKNCESN